MFRLTPWNFHLNIRSVHKFLEIFWAIFFLYIKENVHTFLIKLFSLKLFSLFACYNIFQATNRFLD